MFVYLFVTCLSFTVQKYLHKHLDLAGEQGSTGSRHHVRLPEECGAGHSAGRGGELPGRKE